MPWEIVLTADRGEFSDFGGSSVMGYVACMPYRLVPRFFMDKLFTPPVPAYKDGRAIYAPYPLRKLEASLISNGFNDVAVVPPEKIRKAVNEKTRIVGLSVHDPLGLEPVSFKLSMIFGGGKTWTAKFFEEFGDEIRKLKEKYNFKVVIGGPGTWQLEKEKSDWVDVLFIGEGEIDFPILVKKIFDGQDFPKVVYGRNPKVDQIPPIIAPSRGEVQVTRGCPRGCQFCPVTPETFRSIPLDVIKKEVEVNLKGAWNNISLITDDIMLYGSQKLRVNHDALVKLFIEVMNMRVNIATFPHISAAPVKESPKTVKAIAEIARYDKNRAVAPVVGLETGSEKILYKYMRAKMFPFKPSEWKDVILDATAIMNDNYIYPCYTMTIGYPEETDEDVQQSIELVQSIIDHGFKAWIFPLPVIPMGVSRIRDYPFPVMEKLPSKYWDLLYISWKYDLKITRDLAVVITWRIRNKFIRNILQGMIDKIFNHLENIFRELKDTKGMKSLEFRNINLNSTVGVVWSIYELFRLSVKP
ncbi:MAG: B12-binding domain-containing radical SAM protein [Sulfolobus sp.]|nr:B12-binding domain-containing radical SAM protein [Sulfolobus sp.]